MKAWRIIKRYLPYVIMYGIAFLWIIPILWMADTAFKPRPEILTIPPSWIPSHFTVENIQRLFAQWPFGRWVLNSVIVSSFVTLGSLIVSTLAAFSFARLHWRGRDTLFMILLVFMLLPWQVNVIPLFFTMTKFGFLNTYQGVALPMIAMPIGVFLLRQFFINIPKEHEDEQDHEQRQRGSTRSRSRTPPAGASARPGASPSEICAARSSTRRTRSTRS